MKYTSCLAGFGNKTIDVTDGLTTYSYTKLYNTRTVLSGHIVADTVLPVDAKQDVRLYDYPQGIGCTGFYTDELNRLHIITFKKD